MKTPLQQTCQPTVFTPAYQFAYRMTGWSGLHDQRSDNKDKLIQETSSHIGLFTLWKWNGKQWQKEETFLFSHGKAVSLNA